MSSSKARACSDHPFFYVNPSSTRVLGQVWDVYYPKFVRFVYSYNTYKMPTVNFNESFVPGTAMYLTENLFLSPDFHKF